MTTKQSGASLTTGSNLSHFFPKPNSNNNNSSMIGNNNNTGSSNNKCNISGCHYDKDKEASSSSYTTTTPNNNNSSNKSSILPNNTTTTTTKCAGCRKVIKEKYLLKALDQLWHEDCLKCSCCDCRLGEVGSTLFTKANLLLCRRDYLRLFGTTGYCCACSKMIPAFEMVMKAKTNVYHLECFACQQCSHRFCVGDRYFLCDNKILCEYDYEERLLLAKASFEYAAYSQSLPQNNASYFSNNNNNNNNFNNGSQYPHNEMNFGFQSPPFFNPSSIGTRSAGPAYNYNSLPPYQQNQPSSSHPQNVTRLNNSDDISSGYGSPSPNSS